MSETGTILIIDDDQDFRSINRSVLEKAGYAVLEAEDAESGKALAEEQTPDLILLDVMMEEVDAGFTFAEELGSRFPIILISSIADSSVKVFDAHKLPVKGIIQKPVHAEVLIEKVRKNLDEG
jgi:DNA-binding response OmpR family regulator